MERGDRARRRSVAIGAIAAGLIGFGGCATQQQMLDTGQGSAIETALQRGRFDLNCPTATAVLLSRDFIQPALQGPWVQGLQRLEYTVGVEGCNQRMTVIVICQEGTGTCFAANRDERFEGPYQGQWPPQ